MAEKVIIEIEASTKEAQKNLDNLSKSFEDVYGEVKPLSSRVGELEDRLVPNGTSWRYSIRRIQTTYKRSI